MPTGKFLGKCNLARTALPCFSVDKVNTNSRWNVCTKPFQVPARFRGYFSDDEDVLDLDFQNLEQVIEYEDSQAYRVDLIRMNNTFTFPPEGPGNYVAFQTFDCITTN